MSASLDTATGLRWIYMAKPFSSILDRPALNDFHCPAGSAS